MRGKWVGQYSVSQPVERLLKRMIVPNADLRCTAAEIMGDVYWDENPVTPVYGHSRLLIVLLASLVQRHFAGKWASAAVLSSAHAPTPSFFNPFRDSFKEKEKEPSLSRLLDISLPWSASRPTSGSSASRPASGTESASRPASRTGIISRPVTRARSTPRVPSVTLSASQSRTPESPSDALMASNRHAVVGQVSSTSISLAVRTRTHSRPKSQPKLRIPPDIIPTAARTRKLSTVQASPLVKPQRQIMETESDKEKDASVRKDRESTNVPHPQTSISLSSNSPTRRPLGPRQPSPRITSVSGVMKDLSVSSGQVGTTEKKHALPRLVQLQTPETDHIRTRAPTHLLTPRSVPQTPTRTVSCQAPQQSSAKQLSGKPPRARGRAGVLADLTGFARNVDLGAHGVGRPGRRGGEKKDRGKENTKGRTTALKENKENEGVHPPRKDARVPNGLSGVTPLSPRIPMKEQDASAASIPLAANLSTATTVTKGSVRDRMMDWERERERLREMNRLSDPSADGHSDHGSTILTRTTTGSDSDDDDDSGVEAEVAAEVERPKEVAANTEGERPTTTQTATTLSSSSNLERSQIEVAKIGVRASAQILSSRNGSITALGRSHSVGKQPSEESRAKNDSVTDIGLPVEVRRNSESGLSSLKHSVKASIGRHFCSLSAFP